MRDTAIQPPTIKGVRLGAIILGVLAALVAGAALILSNTHWNFLRGPVGRIASATAGRSIVIHGDLTARLLSLEPEASARDLQIGGSSGVPGDLARVGLFRARIKLLPLLAGRADLPLIELGHADIRAVRDGAGHANWRTPAGGRAPMKLPPIEHLAIHDSRLHLVDQSRRLVIEAQVRSDETLGVGGRGQFRLIGQGSLNNDPFGLTLTGGPLLYVKADKPYAFDADMRAGATHVLARGVLTRPFDFGQVRASLAASGPDMADLYHLTGVAFPNTPAYSLGGVLVRDGHRYSFDPIRGRVGRSDLAGALSVDHSSGRPFVRASLRSHILALSDLGAAVGAKPGVVAAARKGEPHVRLLPDARLDLTRVRSTDAVVDYKAESVMAAGGLPLKQVRLNLKLDHGVLIADPLEFTFPRGRLAGRIRVDARPDTPLDELDLKVSQVRLADFFTHTSPPPLDGVLQARARLSGRGASVREVAASANGALAFIAPHGEVRRSLGELLGVNVTKALGLMLAKDQSDMGVRCAVAQFSARNGVLTADRIVFDSDTVRTDGRGQVDLRDESVDLTLTGHPKRFRLVRLQSPITVSGRLASPKLGLEAGAAPAQAGVAVVLGAALSPLAAILPFVDPGLAHDADCAAAEADAQTAGSRAPHHP
ncbi:AsmA family protein [Phenylobacterium montanum]|uniref:AsmA family protein n=1 Tax=Phenylobacterium montanum TaxID=2823693 RepID=A0A975FWD2_9CAUL|nr:AsmA family protein [Caulobacter sp. S6]QUD86515.1 AsmA family protein [Caulobacter sp. S6]